MDMRQGLFLPDIGADMPLRTGLVRCPMPDALQGNKAFGRGLTTGCAV
jgi:hypothetical protein